MSCNRRDIEVSEATFLDRKRFASRIELFELRSELLAKRVPRFSGIPKIGGDESRRVVDVLIKLRPHVPLGAHEQPNPLAVGAVDATKRFELVLLYPILPNSHRLIVEHARCFSEASAISCRSPNTRRNRCHDPLDYLSLPHFC